MYWLLFSETDAEWMKFVDSRLVLGFVRVMQVMVILDKVQVFDIGSIEFCATTELYISLLSSPYF